jgi:hypothetical protein
VSETPRAVNFSKARQCAPSRWRGLASALPRTAKRGQRMAAARYVAIGDIAVRFSAQ